MLPVLSCTPTALRDAALALMQGSLVAFPTETVYGLGADANNETAVARLYKVKSRPVKHPLIVHISSINHIHDWARNTPKYALTIAETFWPGPITLIFHRTSLAKNFITGGQDTVALRVPGHKGALEMLSQFESIGGKGVAAPSANIFGSVSPTNSIAVLQELELVLSNTDLILNGGNSKFGIESTILDCTNSYPIILRPGSITPDMIEDKIKVKINYKDHGNLLDSIKYSGQFKSHYAPKVKILLNTEPRQGDGFLAYSSFPTPKGAIRLASPKNAEDFAHLLYATFRKADELRLKRLIVFVPSGEGIEKAIRDRLEKASYK
jgi:L-threonylcarbamoyladenylate synthase